MESQEEDWLAGEAECKMEVRHLRRSAAEEWGVDNCDPGGNMQSAIGEKGANGR